MSEKEIMDYKKQRTGKPSTVTSSSIKESYASWNEDSDSETILVTSTKRKHKVTKQCYSREVTMEDAEYMKDTEVMENAEDIENIQYHQSVQNDDDDDEFFDYKSFDSSYTILTSESTPELLNETLYSEEIAHTDTSNSTAVFKTYSSVHDENSQAEGSSDILSSSSFNSPIASFSGFMTYENTVHDLHPESDDTGSVSDCEDFYDCESFYDYNLTEVVDCNENNMEMFSNVNIESGNLTLPEIVNDDLDQNIDRDNEPFELLLVTSNNAVRSSGDESYYSFDAEISEDVSAEIIENLDNDLSDKIDVTVPEMLSNETSEKIDEQDRIRIEKMLDATSESVYSDDLSTTVEDAICTNHHFCENTPDEFSITGYEADIDSFANLYSTDSDSVNDEDAICTNRNLGENTPDELLITGYEMDIKPFANLFSTESDSVNERCSPGPMQRTVNEMIKRDHAKIMASVEMTIKNLTTVSNNNNSSVSGDSSPVDM